MGKETKKQTKKAFPLFNTQQSNAYKEQLNKQSKTLLAGSNLQLQKLMQTDPDPNYISIFKKQGSTIKTVHRLDELEDNEYHFDPKCKRDRHFDKRREKQIKVALNAPITSNQEYGWRQPIDTFPSNFGMKQTFDEKLMVNQKLKAGHKK